MGEDGGGGLVIKDAEVGEQPPVSLYVWSCQASKPILFAHGHCASGCLQLLNNSKRQSPDEWVHLLYMYTLRAQHTKCLIITAMISQCAMIGCAEWSILQACASSSCNRTYKYVLFTYTQCNHAIIYVHIVPCDLPSKGCERVDASGAVMTSSGMFGRLYDNATEDDTSMTSSYSV